MSEKSFHWQDHVPPSEHNGGWAIIMVCHRLLALEGDHAVDDSRLENVINVRERKIEEHGEPPAEFVKAWLKCSGDTYGPLANSWTDQDSDASRARCKALLEATRIVWRRMISTGGANKWARH